MNFAPEFMMDFSWQMTNLRKKNTIFRFKYMLNIQIQNHLTKQKKSERWLVKYGKENRCRKWKKKEKKQKEKKQDKEKKE